MEKGFKLLIIKEMKSVLEVRKFAVEKAVEILGKGVAAKDVVEKAKEIEAYMMGDIVLPESYDEMDAASGIMERVFNAVSVSR